ncbi:MAG: DUF1893 domain-containing protein, partial [Lachnospiraceae bacterium]|nr:DUF1893 domain-containing protein [Lachnospiraceae bacterium]
MRMMTFRTFITTGTNKMVLKKAKELLESGGYTCVLTDGTAVHTSMFRGVKPLVQFLVNGTIPSGLSAA